MCHKSKHILHNKWEQKIKALHSRPKREPCKIELSHNTGIYVPSFTILGTLNQRFCSNIEVSWRRFFALPFIYYLSRESQLSNLVKVFWTSSLTKVWFLYSLKIIHQAAFVTAIEALPCHTAMIIEAEKCRLGLVESTFSAAATHFFYLLHLKIEIFMAFFSKRRNGIWERCNDSVLKADKTKHNKINQNKIGWRKAPGLPIILKGEGEKYLWGNCHFLAITREKGNIKNFAAKGLLQRLLLQIAPECKRL